MDLPLGKSCRYGFLNRRSQVRALSGIPFSHNDLWNWQKWLKSRVSNICQTTPAGIRASSEHLSSPAAQDTATRRYRAVPPAAAHPLRPLRVPPCQGIPLEPPEASGGPRDLLSLLTRFVKFRQPSRVCTSAMHVGSSHRVSPDGYTRCADPMDTPETREKSLRAATYRCQLEVPLRVGPLARLRSLPPPHAQGRLRRGGHAYRQRPLYPASASIARYRFDLSKPSESGQIARRARWPTRSGTNNQQRTSTKSPRQSSGTNKIQITNL